MYMYPAEIKKYNAFKGNSDYRSFKETRVSKIES